MDLDRKYCRAGETYTVWDMSADRFLSLLDNKNVGHSLLSPGASIDLSVVGDTARWAQKNR